MTWRWLRARLVALPADGAVAVATGAWHPGWAVNEELLALLCELVAANTRVLVMVNSKKGATPPPVLRLPRPDDADEVGNRRQATTEELLAWFGPSTRQSQNR